MTILRSLGRALASNPVPVLRYVRGFYNAPSTLDEPFDLQHEADELVHDIRRLFSGAERRKLIGILCDSLRKMDNVTPPSDSQSVEDTLQNQFRRYRCVRLICHEMAKGNHLRGPIRHLT